MKGEQQTSKYQKVSNQVGRNVRTIFIIIANDFFPEKEETAKVS